MNIHRNQRSGRPSRRRIGPWLAAAACATTIAALSTSLPGGQSRPITLAAVDTAARSAPIPIVGVQDSWVNSCDKGKTPNYSPKKADPLVPAVDSSYWPAVAMNTVRFSPEWDIAYHSSASHLQVVQDCFDYWLGQLAAHHVQPEIAFKPDTGYKRQGHVMIPTLRVYVAAMKAFFARYGHQVKIISSWGEPEFHPDGGRGPAYLLATGSAFDATTCPKKPATDVNCGPALAAQMWVAIRHLCPSCTVIAGDFGSNQGKDFEYLKIYQRFLRDIHGGHHVYHPDIWAIHPYTDVIQWEHEYKHHLPLTRPQDTLVANFAGELSNYHYHGGTRIWLDEVSSFTVSPSIYKGEKYSRQVQAAGARQLLTQLVKAGGATKPGEPVVTRIYYMRFAGDTPDALVVRGAREPIYRVFVTRRKKAAASASTVAPITASAATDATRYEIRNAVGDLCLDANDLGSTAGRDGDKVQLWTCYGGANQDWIPVYHGGHRLAWLVNAMYPTKCLNANNLGGLSRGRRVELWACYTSPNELWDFGDLVTNHGDRPLFLAADSQTFTMDADKYHLGNRDKVQIWNYYGAISQRWYPISVR
jgi:hypothetical protein